jgi:hypothetical protein
MASKRILFLNSVVGPNLIYLTPISALASAFSLAYLHPTVTLPVSWQSILSNSPEICFTGADVSLLIVFHPS